MRLTFLGKSTQGGGSPTLYATDRGTYVVQGWKVPDRPPTVVEIPAALLGHVEPGSRLGAELHDTGKFWTDGNGRTWDTYILAGAAVTNPEALAQMDIPGYESCVEVGREPEGH